MKALIFAAGLGTRLKPLTDNKPKALVEVGGVTFLEWQIRRLASFGFKDIVINVHHFGEKVEEFVREFFRNNPHCGLKVQFSEEFDLLRDTGGGVRHAAKLLDDGEPFLVHNVDILSDLDLKSFYNSSVKRIEEGVLASVVVSGRYSDRRLLFDSNNLLAGWENLKTFEVKSPYKKYAALSGRKDAHKILEEKGLRPFAFGGIHVLSPKVFALMESWEEKFSIVDFYLNNAAKFKIEGRYFENLRLLDVGRLEHLLKAEEFMKELSNK